MTNTRDLALKLRERVLPPGRSRYGLVIGIDRYQDTRLDLRCAAADARLIHGLMVDPDCGLFAEGNVELLLDADATKDGIWRSLAGLRRKAGPEDTVWVYFAGHAAPEDDQTYWLAHDSDVNDLYATGLGAEQISGALSRVGADRRIVLLDCCHAAATTLQKNPTRAAVPAEELLGRFQGRGAVTLCSSDGGQRSVELEEHGHGAFTYYLESGLRGEADLDGDGVVTAEELWTYLEGKVSKAARQAGVDQSPLMIGQFSHGLPLSVCRDFIQARAAAAEMIHGLIGLGQDDLSTEEARWCLELLSRPAANDQELQLLSLLKHAAVSEQSVPGLRVAVHGAMAHASPLIADGARGGAHISQLQPPAAPQISEAAEPRLHPNPVRKKLRIYELAKEYGMSGKDLAVKLRDLGFTQIKSHMTGLDQLEVLEVQAKLGAYGIISESSRDDSEEDLGSGLIVRRKRKGVPQEKEAPMPRSPVPEGNAAGGPEDRANADVCREDMEACKAALNSGAGTERHLKHVFHERLHLWQEASELGLADGQWLLARCLLGAIGVGRSSRKATSLFRKAADQGHAVAQYSLGACYFNGDGVTKDQEEGARWFLKAADQGLTIAQFNLGECYSNGEGVPVDPERAVEWFQRAAREGHVDSQLALGTCFMGGEGVQLDAEQAVYWYLMAADQGDARAQFALGFCYGNGEGVSKDPEQAAMWYLKAADQGDADAQCALGECYATGDGVSKNPEQAVLWFREAAERGLARAQYLLGRCYQNGRPSDVYQYEYLEWYRKAASQGNVDAVNAIKEGLNTSARRVKKSGRSIGCFITTAVVKSLGEPDDCSELQALRKFRDTYMQDLPSRRTEVWEYYEVAPRVVAAVEASLDAGQEWNRVFGDFLAPAVEAISAGRLSEAHDLYRRMVRDLEAKWLGAPHHEEGTKPC